MTRNTGLSSVSLYLLESLVSCLQITLIYFDFLGILSAGGKFFQYFQGLLHNQWYFLVVSSSGIFWYLLLRLFFADN